MGEPGEPKQRDRVSGRAISDGEYFVEFLRFCSFKLKISVCKTKGIIISCVLGVKDNLLTGHSPP